MILLRINFTKLFFHYHTELLPVFASIFKKQAHYIHMFYIIIMKKIVNFLIIFNNIMLFIQIIQSFKEISHHLVIKHERFSSICNRYKHAVKLQNELKSKNKETEQVYRKHFNYKII